MREDIGFYIAAPIRQVYQAYLSAATNPPFGRSCKQEPFHTISFGVDYSFRYNMNGGACTIHFMPYGSGTAVNIRFSIVQAVGARYKKYAEDLNASVMRFLPVAIYSASYNMDDFLRPENQVTAAPVQRSADPILSAPPAPPAPQPYITPGAPQPYAAPPTPQPYITPGAPQPYAAPPAPQPYITPGVSQPYITPGTPQPPCAPPAPPAPPVPSGQPVGYCRQCGYPLMTGTRFCANCGTRTHAATKKCINCGAQLKDGATFCPDCGTRM